MSKVDLLFMATRRLGAARILSVQRGAPLPVELTCSGSLKLAQRWLLEFCTEIGSIPYRPDRGCVFMTELRSGQLLTEADVFTSFSVSAAQVAQVLALDQLPDDDPSEILSEAKLVELQLSDTAVLLRIEITSADGKSTTMAVERVI